MSDHPRTLMEVFNDLSEEDFSTYPSGATRGDLPEPVDEPVEDEDEVAWDEYSRTYILGGESVEFFTIGALAQALGREVVTIRSWETKGFIPEATYRAPGDRQDRLYTRTQIEGLRILAEEEGVLDPSPHNSVSATRFPERAAKLFIALAKAGR